LRATEAAGGGATGGRTRVRSLPDKPLLRALVAVAASQTDEALRAGGTKVWQQSFVQDVAAMANLLVTGTGGLRRRLRVLRLPLDSHLRMGSLRQSQG
jgi:hypothetical protein